MLSPVLAVHQTQAAQPALADWLQLFLEPVLDACRFKRSVPIEIRPIGRWGEWCDDIQSCPDRRVALSTKLCFWTSEQIISIYDHEVVHRLLQGSGVASHGPEFFCLNAVLLSTTKRTFKTLDRLP